jgi:hypothetical protein
LDCFSIISLSAGELLAAEVGLVLVLESGAFVLVALLRVEDVFLAAVGAVLTVGFALVAASLLVEEVILVLTLAEVGVAADFNGVFGLAIDDNLDAEVDLVARLVLEVLRVEVAAVLTFGLVVVLEVPSFGLVAVELTPILDLVVEVEGAEIPNLVFEEVGVIDLVEVLVAVVVDLTELFGEVTPPIFEVVVV